MLLLFGKKYIKFVTKKKWEKDSNAERESVSVRKRQTKKHTDYGNNRKTKPYYVCCNKFCVLYGVFQVWMGELRHKCVKNVPDGWNVTHEEWRM